MAELRHGAENGQLDPELVESFVALLEREGPTFAQDADFEIELEFERRVRTMAEPRSSDPDERSSHAKRPQPQRGDWRSTVRELGQRTLNRG